MTGPELTTLCAEALGYKLDSPNWPGWMLPWHPLTNDAQAMALVKRFGLDLTSPARASGDWGATVSQRDPNNKVTGWKLVADADDPDLNRAICKCVAKMVKK